MAENIPLYFPFLSSLPFFATSTVAFVCQLGIIIIAWSVGRGGLSLWWVLLGCLAWWMAIKGRQKAQNTKRAFEAMRNNEQQFIRERMQELPSWVFFPDQERAEWFNRMLQQLWPFLNKYLQELIISIMEPAVNGALPPLMKFRFDRITMGDEAFRVGGMKVYQDHVARGEIIVDAEILYAGDCEVKARVGKFPIGFNQITLSGTMRIIFKPLVHEMPFVGGITAFFLSTPAVDFNLTEMADVMDIPGLSELMRKVVQEQVNYFLVLPNKISIPLIKDISRYDLKFYPPEGVLRIFVAEAENLMRADIGIIGKGKSDPYCVIRVGAQIFTTQVVKDNINPVFSEYFEAVVDQASGQSVDLEVYDKDQGNKDDFLGRLSIDVYSIAKEGTVDRWFRLEECDTGNLRLRFYWFGLTADSSSLSLAKREAAMMSDRINLATCVLMVFIDHATDLPNLKKTASEPYAYCVASVGKNQSYRTTTVKRTYDPVWESQHSFLINDPATEVLNFTIFDERSNRKLGWRDVKIQQLLDQSNLEMSGTLRLDTPSSQKSELAINLRLRILKSISLAEAASSPDPKLEPVKHQNSFTDSTGAQPPAATTASDGTVSAKEFHQCSMADLEAPNEFAGQQTDGGVAFPVNLEAESQLRQRPGKQSAAIKMSLSFGEARKVLFVTVHEVLNIGRLHPQGGLGAFYVSITSSPFKTKRRTDDFHGDVENQSYEKTLEFPIENESLLKTAYLEVKVKSRTGAFNKDAIGQIIVPLAPAFGVNSHTQWYTLEAADSSA